MNDQPTEQQEAGQLQAARDRSLRGSRPPLALPGYRFERFLGAGAYGEVWQAVDRNTRRRVAIKFYAHRGGLDWSLLSREVEKLAFLFADRRVVQLLEVGWDADPPYYVMEYLEQGSLEEHLQRGPLPVTDALAVFQEVALGLLHSHGKGVLHCDLKPANILLDHDLKPRLADFGQSRLSNEQTPALGTLFYMAPEQADLNALPNAAWDVYALGALLYRMLTGEPPRRSEEAVQEIEQAASVESRLHVYQRVIHHSPRLRAHRRVRGVDNDLAEIIERCLEPAPAKRFANVQAVIDALQDRNVRRARRPLLVLGALGPALLLLVMSIFAWNSYKTAVKDASSAVSRRAAESNRFASQFVAEAVARQIDRRFQAIDQLASDTELRERLIAATGHGELNDPIRRQLQERLVELREEEREVDDRLWFITDVNGMQVARIPESTSLGKNFAYRDYFNGLGKRVPPDTPGLRPIEGPYQSIVYLGQATGHRQVAFSAPIWSADEAETSRRIIGVIAVAVELGNFTEIHSHDDLESKQIAVLVDARPDENGRPGTVLEHPHLTELLEAKGDHAAPRVYLDEKDVGRLKKVIKIEQQMAELQQLERDRELAAADAQGPESPVDAPLDPSNPAAPLVAKSAPDVESASLEKLQEQLTEVTYWDEYRDPVGGEYAGRWLAAIEPVMIEEEHAINQPGTWAVIVQERADQAMRPVSDLASHLLRRGIWAAGLMFAVLTISWGFVITLLNEPTRYGWRAAMRQTLGLSTDRLSELSVVLPPTPSAESVLATVAYRLGDSGDPKPPAPG